MTGTYRGYAWRGAAFRGAPATATARTTFSSRGAAIGPDPGRGAVRVGPDGRVIGPDPARSTGKVL